MPTANSPGYTKFRGRTSCICLSAWVLEFEKAARSLGFLENQISITQMTGSAEASAGTHSQGGALDYWETSRDLVWLARQMGMAAWVRTKAQGFKPHTHGVLNGCQHNTPARYQIRALARGKNGLGKGGLGGDDDGPGPQKLRTWSEGINWARNLEDDMSQYADQLDDLTSKVKYLQKSVDQLRTAADREVYRDEIVLRQIGYLMIQTQKTGQDVESNMSTLELIEALAESSAANESDSEAKAKLEAIKGLLD